MSESGTGVSPEERADLIKQLQESRAEFVGLIGGVTDAQWSATPAQNCWSVQQTAEHLVLSEGFMLAGIQQALTGPPNPDWEAQDARKTRFLGRVLPDRNLKATAPDVAQPHNHWTREQTITRYERGRAKTLELVENLDQPVKDRTFEHPFPVFNTLNSYHWLLYIPLHNVRHNRQIAEIVKELAACELS